MGGGYALAPVSLSRPALIFSLSQLLSPRMVAVIEADLPFRAGEAGCGVIAARDVLLHVTLPGPD